MGKHTVEIELPDGYEPTGDQTLISECKDTVWIRFDIRKVSKWRPARFADLQKIYESGDVPIKARFRSDDIYVWTESQLTGWNSGLWIASGFGCWNFCEVLDYE